MLLALHGRGGVGCTHIAANAGEHVWLNALLAAHPARLHALASRPAHAAGTAWQRVGGWG